MSSCHNQPATCRPVQFCEPENFGLTFPSFVGPMGPPGGALTFLNSLEDLRLLDPSEFPEGYIAYVGGHTTINDGGQGYFQYVSTATGTDNDGTLITPSNAIGRWMRLFSGAADVRWFGATGDGVTNDQPACSAAADSHNKVYFPAGTYLLGPNTGDFIFSMGNRSGLEFFGDGGATILKLADSIGRGKSMFGSGNAQTLSNVHWHDLTIDLNGAGNLQTAYGDPLRLNSFIYAFSGGITDIMIERVSVLNGSGSQMIRLTNDTSTLGNRITIRDCRFHNFGIGVPGNLSQDTSCIYVFADNLAIVNCRFSCDSFTFVIGKGHTAIEYHSGVNVQIRNCVFSELQLPILAASTHGNIERAEVTDCVFTNCAYAMTFNGYGTGDIEGFVYARNQFYSLKAVSVGIIYVGAAGEPSLIRRGLQFMDSRFESNTASQGRAALILSNSYWSDVTIHNCIFRYLTAQAIFVDGPAFTSDRMLNITDCTFDSCGSDIAGSPIFPTDGRPVQIVISPANTDPMKQVKIENCTFANSLAKSYAVESHIALGSLLRAKIISVRFATQPDDAFEIVRSGTTAAASVQMDILTGHMGALYPHRSDYYGGFLLIDGNPVLTLANAERQVMILDGTGAVDITDIIPPYGLTGAPIWGLTVIFHFQNSSAHRVVDGGNLALAGDFVWSGRSTLTLTYGPDGLGNSRWIEVARSVN